MTSEQRQAQSLGPIKIDLGFNELVQRVDTNITQEIMVITADKVRLCLLDALDRVDRRKAWVAPAGILATLVVVFPTTTFQDFLGLSKDFWKATFFLWALSTFIWLVRCLLRVRGSLTTDEIVDLLRTSGLGGPPQPPPQQAEGDLIIVKALYGGSTHTIEVTHLLSKMVNGSSLHVLAGNQLAGDPCPNVMKDLVVMYRFQNRELTKTVKEGQDLDLP